MEDIKQMYSEVDKNLRIKRGIIGCILSIILVPAGSSMDYFFYPNHLAHLLEIRLLCSFLTALILAAHFSEIGKRHIKLLTFIWLILMQMTMCYIIFATDKYLSTYYAALNIAIMGVVIILPLVALEMLGFCVITIILYFIAAFDPPLTNEYIMYSNVYFILLTTIISITAAYLNSRYRFQEFLLNHKLKSAISELKSTQGQLIQSEKINALGSLSAGLLHEVNNPLNYTMTALQIIKANPQITQDVDLKEIVGDVEEGMSRIKAIVGDLHSFAYPSEADKQIHFPIYEAVASALRFTASELQNVEVINNVKENIEAMASKTHIVQVLINLITNASKAIKKSGHKGVVTISIKNDNNRIIVSVADNGAGMSEETLKRIFDPFFTTAEVGKGVGLGLSICHTIVKTHGGNLYATSELGKGSVFYFDLPA